MKYKNTLVGILGLCMILIVTSSISVSAEVYPYLGTGQWPSNNVSYQIQSDVPSAYNDPIYWGGWMWENYSNINLHASSSSFHLINVMAYYYGLTGWSGLTYINGITLEGGGSIDSQYRNAEIHINRTGLETASPTLKKVIACHEFGHALSLAHSNTLNSIMNSDVLEAVTAYPSLNYQPSSYDIAAVNNRY